MDDNRIDAAGASHILPLSREDGSLPNPNYVVPALHRGLAVLSLFRRDRPRLSLSEITALLGLPRATAFRLVYTLESLGFLKKSSEDERYDLGTPVLSLGYALLASMDVIDRAEMPLRRLRDRTGGSVHLARRDGPHVVYLMRFAAPDAMTGNVQVGARLPVHATTLGRALLMDSTEETLAALFGSDAELPAFTRTTARTISELATQLGEDRDRGYVKGRSIYENGLDSMAAPVRDENGDIVAAVSVVGFGLLNRGEAEEADLLAGLLATTEEIGRPALSGV